MNMENAETQIANLLHRYADAVDRGDFDTVATLLKSGSILDSEGTCLANGYAQVLEMYNNLIRLYADGTPKTQHVLSNLILQLNGDGSSASAKAYYSVFQKQDDGSIKAIICGQYQSKFKKVDGKWVFIEHRMHPRIVGDMSRHLKIRIDEIQPQK